jgi:hypothetical protein
MMAGSLGYFWLQVDDFSSSRCFTAADGHVLGIAATESL